MCALASQQHTSGWIQGGNCQPKHAPIRTGLCLQKQKDCAVIGRAKHGCIDVLNAIHNNVQKMVWEGAEVKGSRTTPGLPKDARRARCVKVLTKSARTFASVRRSWSSRATGCAPASSSSTCNHQLLLLHCCLFAKRPKVSFPLLIRHTHSQSLMHSAQRAHASIRTMQYTEAGQQCTCSKEAGKNHPKHPEACFTGKEGMLYFIRDAEDAMAALKGQEEQQERKGARLLVGGGVFAAGLHGAGRHRQPQPLKEHLAHFLGGGHIEWAARCRLYQQVQLRHPSLQRPLRIRAR